MLATVAAQAHDVDNVPAFCNAQEEGESHDIHDYDALRDADDWCKPAHNEPLKAKRQMNKNVAIVRTVNNQNRYYLDPKLGHPQGPFVIRILPLTKTLKISPNTLCPDNFNIAGFGDPMATIPGGRPCGPGFFDRQQGTVEVQGLAS